MTFAETMDAMRAGNAQKTAPINSASLIQKLAADENARKAAEAAPIVQPKPEKKDLALKYFTPEGNKPDLNQPAGTLQALPSQGMKPFEAPKPTEQEKLAKSMLNQGYSGVGGAKPAVSDGKTDMQKVSESMGSDYSHVGDLGKVIPDAPEIAQLKTPKDSAIELASAKPSQAAAVIDKLKEEEKKGGPNFFDIIEAFAAGWNGNVPLYVKKALAEKDQADTLQQMQVQADTQAATSEAERNADFENTQRLQAEARKYDTEQFNQEMALKREAAGLPPLGDIGKKLSLSGLSAFGGQ